ncbi:hypothetical protein AB0M20_24560 [Actinoplanes sp. NPDC051633]|uniref:hypothetical protein n=1 Tax=Actinoplanes sp. NPDC051633 TaxID=3155670 RepID=UPI003448ED40
MTTEVGPWETGIGRVARWLPYATLTASTVLTLLTQDEGTSHVPLPVTFAVVAGAALWLLVFVTLRPAEWDRRGRGFKLVFFAGLLL